MLSVSDIVTQYHCTDFILCFCTISDISSYFWTRITQIFSSNLRANDVAGSIEIFNHESTLQTKNATGDDQKQGNAFILALKHLPSSETSFLTVYPKKYAPK